MPLEQNAAFFTLISEQEKYNPHKVGLLNNIKAGNLESAIPKAIGTWVSLPGSVQQRLTMEQINKIFKEALVSELKGKSIIATPKGQLLSN